MKEVEDAIKALIHGLPVIDDRETVFTYESSGRVLAEDIVAAINVPSFPKSAMDGYAVRSEDISGASSDDPVTLEVIASIYAGDAVPVEVKGRSDLKGTAVRIMTGGIVPEGFDTVIKQEDTDYGEDEVKILRSQPSCVNICKVGEDIRKGSIVIPAGTLIRRSEAGVIGSLGIPEVSVLRKVRVSVISTGSELLNAGESLTEGKIFNSISVLLKTALDKPAFTADTVLVPDDEDIIVQSIRKAFEVSDMVITTGGVSVGKKDLIPSVLDRIGAVKLFSGINIKPGSPTVGAHYNGKALLCLSGNPYAAVANFDLYMGHVISEMTGCDAFKPVRETAVLTARYGKPSNVRRLVRAYVRSGIVTVNTPDQASSVMSSFLGSNCYIDFPKGSEKNAGDEVDIIRIPEVFA